MAAENLNHGPVGVCREGKIENLPEAPIGFDRTWIDHDDVWLDPVPIHTLAPGTAFCIYDEVYLRIQDRGDGVYSMSYSKDGEAHGYCVRVRDGLPCRFPTHTLVQPEAPLASDSDEEATDAPANQENAGT